MLVYVDEIILTGNSQSHMDHLITALSSHFSLKDLGRLSYFLGIEAHHSSQGLLLTQHRYIADLLHHTKMTDSNPVPTPMCPNKHLMLTSGVPLRIRRNTWPHSEACNTSDLLALTYPSQSKICLSLCIALLMSIGME